MRDEDKTKEQLIAELVEMRQAVCNRDVALEALRESEEQHRTLFETMPLGVVYQNVDGHITAANPAAERILGLTLDEGDVADLKPVRYVCLSMRDTGCGMSQEVQAGLFEPFFTNEFQGRGMGLAAAYGIVENHGGHILVQSKEGGGSTFEVYLPAMQASAGASSSAAASAAPAGTAAPVTDPVTVLIVQGDEAVRRLAERMVERLGYRGLAARSGHGGRGNVLALGTGTARDKGDPWQQLSTGCYGTGTVGRRCRRVRQKDPSR